MFHEVAVVLSGMVEPELGTLRYRAHRYGIKVWFETDAPPPEHYEAQVIGARHVEDAKTLALEIGFHAEHGKVTANDDVLARLTAQERRWRRVLGKDAVAGPFLGRAQTWRRVSETWPDPDLGDTDLAIEVGARLSDYITALEPLRRGARR